MSQQYGQSPTLEHPYHVPGGWQAPATGTPSHPSEYQGTPPAGAPGYGYGTAGGYPGYPAPQPTNTLAVVSLITSLLGLGPVGVVTGHVARSQIRRTRQAGAGLALAGLILGTSARCWGSFSSP